MLERMKKRPIDERLVRYAGPSEKIEMIDKYAEELGLKNIEDSVSFAEAFPEYLGNEARMALNGYRSREGLSQEQLAELTGIPRRHISEMENGKRPIGKESAKKLAAALHCDYRRLL
jgi:DNA-binding XRE family transcriptional regulator